MNSPLKWCSSLAAATCLLLAGSCSSVQADSIWVEAGSNSLFSDRKATKVGDILTVVVQENYTAAKDQNKQTTKKSGMDASIGSFLYPPGASSLLTKKGQMPAMKMESKNDFSGGGSVKNSESITARVAVRIIDVLPNQNLVIEGRRQTSFSGETQEVVLRGIVRSEDILANNTVLSSSIADAKISISSKGSVADSARKGWFGKVWDKVTPF